MSGGETAAVRKAHAIKKAGLMAKKNSDLKELEALRRQKHKELEDGHKKEVAAIWNWYKTEMQEEEEYFLEELVGAQR